MVADARGTDAAGCTDRSLFPNRMPSHRIEKCVTRDFDPVNFTPPQGLKTHVKGGVTLIDCAASDRRDDRSGLEVVRNHENPL